jgi:hypothetical protein
VLFISSCASVPFEDWDRSDTIREAVFLGTLAVDAYQTHRISDDDRFYEMNPILGKDPSHGAINLYMVGCAVGHTVVSGLLKPKYREAWQYFWIGAEAYTVVGNHRLGVE